jgi:hypothetical protein
MAVLRLQKGFQDKLIFIFCVMKHNSVAYFKGSEPIIGDKMAVFSDGKLKASIR